MEAPGWRTENFFVCKLNGVSENVQSTAILPGRSLGYDRGSFLTTEAGLKT